MLVTTQMREAFARIPVPSLVAPVGDYIVRSLVKGSGQIKLKRVWNAKLSYRTHQTLVRQNVMPNV
jgi:hypothetical protein